MVKQVLIMAAATLMIKDCSHPQVKVESPSLVESSKHFENAAAEIRKGMEGVDPVALNKLLAENKDLRDKFLDARSRLESLGPLGGVVVVSPTQRVFFQITGYRGQLRLDAWVNNPDNWFLSNQVLALADTSPSIDYGIADKLIAKAAKEAFETSTNHSLDDWAWITACNDRTAALLPAGNVNQAIQRFTSRMSDVRHEIDTAYRAEVDRGVRAFLGHPTGLPSPNLGEPQAIDRRLKLTEGDHAVYVRVTPETLDSFGNWELEYRTFVSHTGSASSQLEQIALGRLDNKENPGELGKPLAPAVAANFYVKIEK